MSDQPAVVLEPAALDLVEATADPPFLFEAGPEGARKILDDLPGAPVEKVPVDQAAGFLRAALAAK